MQKINSLTKKIKYRTDNQQFIILKRFYKHYSDELIIVQNSMNMISIINFDNYLNNQNQLYRDGIYT